MSRYLSEDSDVKRVAATEFGVRQLERRPAPAAATGGIEAARVAAYIDTSAIDYVEPDFLDGTDANFQRTSNTIFDVNAAGRLLVPAGNPGAYLLALSAHQVDGDSGSDSYIEMLFRFLAPLPGTLFVFPGWFDSGGGGDLGSTFAIQWPLFLDAASNGTQLEPIPWTQTLYNYESDEDMVIEVKGAIIKDGSLEDSNSMTILMSLVRLGDATNDIIVGA